MIWLVVDSSTVGGIERHVATLAEALGRAGIAAEIVLIADHGDNPWLAQLKAARLGYRVLAGGIGALWRGLSDARPDLIHTHGYKANILGRFAGRLRGIPVVSTFHAGERGAFPVSLYQLVDEWSSCLGGRIAVSGAIRETLPFASTFVGNFLLSPPDAPRGPLPRKIGFVGRLSHEKAPDRFCEIARRHRGLAEFHIYGDGPMRAALQAEFGDDAIFHGLVTDLAPVWASLGLLIMPSRAEGLPMAALEALSAGVPIVATAVGGLPALVETGRTGWLMDGESASSVDVALSAWAAQSESCQVEMRAACWRLARDGYSERTQLPLILEVYGRAGFRPQMCALPAT